jgi:hypothetical protein
MQLAACPGPMWRRAQPQVPVQPRRQRILARRSSHILHPGRPFGPSLHLTHRPDDAVPDPLAHQPRPLSASALIAHLGRNLRLSRRVGQQRCFVDCVGQRLLHVDVLAHLHRHHGDRGVRVVRRSHYDRSVRQKLAWFAGGYCRESGNCSQVTDGYCYGPVTVTSRRREDARGVIAWL